MKSHSITSSRAANQATLDTAFAQGNYALVAAAGKEDDWRTHAAKGLIADHPDAIGILADEQGYAARYYQAALLFLDGDDEQAVDVLRTCNLPEARRFRALLEKPTINVLAQLPWFRRAPHTLLAGARRDRKFRIRNISFHENDVPNRPGADVWDFVDREDPPDLYFCSMLEWHVIPKNIHELDCPLIGMTTDYDVLIQTVHPWLRAFDLLVTTDQGQWSQLSAMMGRPVATYPRCFTLSPTLPSIPGIDREIDLFLSGTIAHPYHLDRSRFLCEVLRQENLSTRMVQGFLSDAAYQTLLGQSKVVYSYIRIPGGMPTRALEALSMGCAVVVQEGSTLSLFFDDAAGVTTYPSTPDGLVKAVCKVCDDWNRYGPAAQQGARTVRESFSEAKVGSRLMRFMAFQGSRIRQTRAHDDLLYKRPIVSKGAVAGSGSTQVALRKRSYADMANAFRSKPAAGPLINMARELILEHAYACRSPRRDIDKALPSRALIDEALKLSRAGMSTFRDSLVLRFNAVRAGIYFGDADQKREALDLAHEVLAEDIERWKADRFDDVLPWDFFSRDFNYRGYFEYVLDEVGNGNNHEHDRIRLIAASLCFLSAKESKCLEDARRAVDFDPDFPYYRLFLAERLLESEDASTRDQALVHLENLADGSVVFTEVARYIENLQIRAPMPIRRFTELVTPAQRFDEITYTIERLDEADSSASEEIETTDDTPRRVEISVLMPYCETLDSLEETLKLLSSQSVARRCQVIAATPHDAASSPPLHEQRGIGEYVGIFAEVVFVEHAASFQQRGAAGVQALRACARRASAPLLTVARPCQQFTRRGLQNLRDAIGARRKVDVVYADYRRVRTSSEQQAKSLSLHKGRSFSRRALFGGDIVGPAAIWRRSLLEEHDFDPELGSGAEYGFFLQASLGSSFFYLERQVALVWGATSELYCDNRRPIEACRRKHWCSNWGDLPAPTAARWIPGEFERTGLAPEAYLHLGLGDLPRQAVEAVESLADLITTALYHDDLPLALAALASCRRVAPCLTVPLLVEGRLLEKIGRYDAAADLYEKVACMTPYRSAGVTRLGLLQHRRGDTAGAIESLEQTLAEKGCAVFADDAVLRANLGALWLASNAPEKAEEFYRKAIDVDSDDIESYRGLATALDRQGKEDECRNVLARARAIDPQQN